MGRLAIAYVLSGRAGEAANALRRRYDPAGAELLPAHVTLADLGQSGRDPARVREFMHDVASLSEPFEIVAGAAATFLPVSPVVYLQVGPVGRLTALHDLLQERLGWEESFPFVPHVTITAFLSAEETARVFAELRGEVGSGRDVLTSLTLFEERGEGWGEVWRETLSKTGTATELP